MKIIASVFLRKPEIFASLEHRHIGMYSNQRGYESAHVLTLRFWPCPL